MRKHYATLLITAAYGLGANAQITLTDPDDVPTIGAVHPTHTAAYAAPPAGGTGVLFDYSGLVQTGTGEWSWIDPAVYSNAAAFPSAELATTNGTDTIFYEVTANGMERVGERQIILFYDVEVPLTDPSLDLKLPLTYGGIWDDNIAASSFMADVYPADRTGTIHGEADGWGTLQLPGVISPIEVLRVNTYKQEVNIVHTGPPLGDVTVTHKRREYNYYGKWLKQPILRVYTDSLTSILASSNSSGIEWIDADPVGLAELASSSSVAVYPNPVQDVATIAFINDGAAVQVEVMDAVGRVVHTQIGLGVGNGLNTIRLTTQDWQPGCYTVCLRSDKGIIGTQRLVKN